MINLLSLVASDCRPLLLTIMEYFNYIFAMALFPCCVLLLYVYNKKIYSFWKKQNVPCVATLPFFGSYKPHHEMLLHEVEQHRYNEYGRLYGRFDGRTAVLSVAEPELLKRVFVKDFHLFPNRRHMQFGDHIMDHTLFALENEDWKRARTIVSPTLTSAKLKRMLPLLENCADILVENLSKVTAENKEIECQRYFGAFVIDTIGRCAFGMNINSLDDENHPFVTKAKALLDSAFDWRTLLIILCPQVVKYFRLGLLNSDSTLFFRNIVLEVIEQRKKCRGREDFLQIMLDAQNEVQDQNNNNVKSKYTDTSSSDTASNTRSTPADSKNAGKGLCSEELISQCVTFFVAGYDATTSLLSYAMYNLAVNQECQTKVVEEMERALEKHDGVLNYECLNEMKYLEAVLHECLRLCPSMARMERAAEYDCVLGDTDIRIKKGMLISIPVYAIHRDPEWFPEPEVFKPERFYEPDTNRPQYVYLPFGAGPRLCIGMRFVQTQVKLGIAKILQRFHVQPASTTPKNLAIKELRNVLRVEKVQVSLVERQRT